VRLPRQPASNPRRLQKRKKKAYNCLCGGGKRKKRGTDGLKYIPREKGLFLSIQKRKGRLPSSEEEEGGGGKNPMSVGGAEFLEKKRRRANGCACRGGRQKRKGAVSQRSEEEEKKKRRGRTIIGALSGPGRGRNLDPTHAGLPIRLEREKGGSRQLLGT